MATLLLGSKDLAAQRDLRFGSLYQHGIRVGLR